MSKYDEYLDQLTASVTSAGEYIPKMCAALEDEKLPKEEIKEKVTKDCLAAGLAKQTIIHNMPEEYKDSKKVEAGKIGAIKKKEILVEASGASAAEAENSPKDEKEQDSKTFPKVTKDVEYQPPTPVTKEEKFLANKVNELLEINKFQAREINKLKTVSKVEGTGALNETDIDCTNHSMYHKAQAKIENLQSQVNELQARVDAFDKINFTPATEVQSPPEIFQVPKECDESKEFFYPKMSPIQAVGKLKQLLNSVTAIEIGWRVLE